MHVRTKDGHESHTPGSSAEARRAIWSPQASAASPSSRAGSDQAPHSYSPHTLCVCVCVCVWSRLHDGNDESFLWAAVCSLQGYSPPAPPVDGSEEDAEWAGSELLISCAVKVRRCRRPQPSRLLLLSLKRYRALNEFFIFTFLISMDWSFARCVFGLVWLTVTETEKYSMCRKKDKSKSSYQIFGIFALHFFIFNN